MRHKKLLTFGLLLEKCIIVIHYYTITIIIFTHYIISYTFILTIKTQRLEMVFISVHESQMGPQLQFCPGPPSDCGRPCTHTHTHKHMFLCTNSHTRCLAMNSRILCTQTHTLYPHSNPSTHTQTHTFHGILGYIPDVNRMGSRGMEARVLTSSGLA